MGRTACTEPQCLYKGALYLLPYIRGVLWVNFDVCWLNIQTTWFEKLAVVQLVIEFQAFYVTQVPLLCSKEPANGPDESTLTPSNPTAVSISVNMHYFPNHSWVSRRFQFTLTNQTLHVPYFTPVSVTWPTQFILDFGTSVLHDQHALRGS